MLLYPGGPLKYNSCYYFSYAAGAKGCQEIMEDVLAIRNAILQQ